MEKFPAVSYRVISAISPGRGFAYNHKEWVLFGLLLETGLMLLLSVTGLDRGSPLLQVLFWIPFFVYLVAIWRIGRTEPIAPSWQVAAIILFFALLFHATVLFSQWPLSNDIYRYYWDGKTTYYGWNPYAYSPAADALSSLTDPNWELVMNRDVHTMYPPFAQLVFYTAYAIRPGMLTLRLFSVAFSLLSTGVLILILKELRLDVRYSVALLGGCEKKRLRPSVVRDEYLAASRLIRAAA